MKQLARSTMYSKMFMVPPFVYEKLKKCLDKVDTQTIEKINKPYFVPPMQQQNVQNVNPMIPPNPPQPHLPPPIIPRADPNVSFESQDDPNVSVQEMNWDREWDYPEYQTEEEQEFVDDPPLFDDPSSIVKKEEVVQEPTYPSQYEIGTQTEEIIQPRQYDFSTQTDQEKRPILVETGIQTTPQAVPLVKDSGIQTEFVPIASTVSKKQNKKPVVVSKVVKNKTQRMRKKQTQLVPIQPIRARPFEHQRQIETDIIQPIQQMEIEYQRTPPPALIAPENYPLLPRRQRVVTSYVPRVRAHLEHMGQPVRTRRVTQFAQPKQLTFEEKRLVPQPKQFVTRRAEDIELPMDETQEVGLSHPRYTVEFPSEEPPGERLSKRQYQSEVVHPSKIIKNTYSKRRKLNTEAEIMQPRELERFDDPNFGRTSFMNDPNFGRYGLPKRNINLADTKKRFQCDRCGLSLSTRYNLIRHQEREAKRFSKGGELVDRPNYDPFINWNKPTKKRTSSETQQENPSQTKKMVFKKWNEN